MPIQHQRLIPRYTRWRLLEDGVLAEERLWNNTVGSGTVSFSGVVEAFFSSENQNWWLFFRAPDCLRPRQLGRPLVLLRSRPVCPRITPRLWVLGVIFNLQGEELSPFSPAPKLGGGILPIPGRRAASLRCALGKGLWFIFALLLPTLWEQDHS